jgi:hypothetical protein
MRTENTVFIAWIGLCAGSLLRRFRGPLSPLAPTFLNSMFTGRSLLPATGPLFLALAIAAGCESSATTSLSPSSLAKCQVGLSGGQLAIQASGGAGSVTVSANAECGWTATASAEWISSLTPVNGQGSGEIRFQVAPNPTGAPRHGEISLNGAIATVTQAGAPCQVQISPRRQTVPAIGGTGTVTVTALNGCSWTVASSAAWLTAAAGGGTGTHSLDFSVAQNDGLARSGSLTIGDQTFVVTQPAHGDEQCAYTLSPDAVSIGSGGGRTTFAIRAGAGCGWTAISGAPWLTVEGSSTGTGNGSVTIRLSANTGAARTGSVSVADQTFTVTQAGGGATECSYSLDRSAQSATAASSASSVAVVTTAGCSWTATTAATWLTITDGASGTGAGTVSFTIAANAGPARSATIQIAGAVHTVNQASGCSVSIDPESATSPASGGAGAPIDVSAASDCTWTATTAETWITVTAGAAGSGDGSVGYSVEENAGDARTGTITVGTTTFTLSQAAACSYSLDPTQQSFSKNSGTSDPVSVTTEPGCGWTSISNDSWITVKTGANGTGSGTMTFSVSKNDGTDERVGTLTIAGRTFTVTQAGR